MVSVTVSLVAFLALVAWRFAFASLLCRPLGREMAAPQQRDNNLLDRVGVAVIAGDHFENGSQGVDPFEREDRAEAYLRHVVALTGATQMGDNYVLDVGTTRFQVGDRYVRRLRDVSDPKCEYEETCFYLPCNRMPKAEQIATALLELTNNPELFERWAAQIGAVKADGQVFACAQVIGWR
jgi:hypothetical protein